MQLKGLFVSKSVAFYFALNGSRLTLQMLFLSSTPLGVIMLDP